MSAQWDDATRLRIGNAVLAARLADTPWKRLEDAYGRTRRHLLRLAQDAACGGQMLGTQQMSQQDGQMSQQDDCD